VSRDPVRTDIWRVDLVVHRGHGGGVGECVLPNAGDLARYRDLLDVVVGGEWYALPPPGIYYLDVMAYGPWIITLELVDPGSPLAALLPSVAGEGDAVLGTFEVRSGDYTINFTFDQSPYLYQYQYGQMELWTTGGRLLAVLDAENDEYAVQQSVAVSQDEMC
jgi:hypothetical protein